jgi:hypothetical protein
VESVAPSVFGLLYRRASIASSLFAAVSFAHLHFVAALPFTRDPENEVVP